MFIEQKIINEVEMKKIMIVGAGILQLPAIQKAKELGLNVVVVDMNPQAVGFKESGIEKEVISTIDIPKVLEAAKRHKIDGIMTLASDMPMRTIAKVSKELGLVGISESTALKATDKILMREALQQFHVPIPAFYKVSTKDEFLVAIRALREKGYKCIVKPADNSGSRGVDLLKKFDENSLEKAFMYSKGFSRSGNIVVEEYMEGPEVSVETLSIDGECHVIQITDKLTTGAPYFVEMGHNQPSTLPTEIRKKIGEVAIAANHALGIMDGPSHTEIKITQDGPKIVELGARLGGDNITTHLVPLSTGVDMVECCIHIALGEKVDYQSTLSKASAIRYIKAPLGEISEIRGIEKARHIPGIKQVSVVHGVGEESKEIKSSIDRVAFVISQADTVEQAISHCESALKEVHVIVK